MDGHPASRMREDDREVASELKRRLVAAAGDRIRRVIVYGSRARGEADLESDLDILVLVQSATPDIENRIDGVAIEVMREHAYKPILSVHILAEDQFERRLAEGFSFYHHVREEGVTV